MLKQIQEMIWENMAKLKKDWDSYGADPPSEHAIARAKGFVDAMMECSSPEIAPSVEGGM